MIASGEKKEEYREIKPYWERRLMTSQYPSGWKYAYGGYDAKFKNVVFRLGYAKDAPTMLVRTRFLCIGEAKPEWSDNWPGPVFIIELGEIVSITNYPSIQPLDSG